MQSREDEFAEGLPEELASEEIDCLPPEDWDRFVVFEKSDVSRNLLPDGSSALKSDFGSGSYWTVIYGADGHPARCEHENVRFLRIQNRIWVYPPQGS